MPSRPAGDPHDHRAASAAGGRPHHLASVVHHFLSDVEPGPGVSPGKPARVVVAGYACGELVDLTGRALGSSDRALEIVVLDEAALGPMEGLIPHGGAGLVRPADLVWCLAAQHVASLAGVQLMGRWIRCLECHRVDIVLANAPGGGEGDLGTLRRLAGLVAPGVSVNVTIAGPGQWEEVCTDLARRLDQPAESGTP